MYQSSIDGDVDQMVTKMLIKVSIDTWLALPLEHKIQIFTNCKFSEV